MNALPPPRAPESLIERAAGRLANAILRVGDACIWAGRAVGRWGMDHYERRIRRRG